MDVVAVLLDQGAKVNLPNNVRAFHVLYCEVIAVTVASVLVTHLHQVLIM